MDINSFFKQDLDKKVEVFVSDRFKNENGEQIPFIIKPVLETQHEKIKSESKGYKNSFDFDVYKAKLMCESIVSPNLKDTDLQKFYGVLGEENLIKNMLLSGEFLKLYNKVLEISGFNEDLENMVEYLKN